MPIKYFYLNKLPRVAEPKRYSMRRRIYYLMFLGILSIFFCFSNNAFANVAQQQDERSITGTVSDIDGNPVPGVTILIKGTSKGTTSDLNGTYQLQDVSDEAVLVFSFVGMTTI